MELIRNIEKSTISFVVNNKEIMNLQFVADEFCWIIDSNEVIVITEEIDPYFYNNLRSILDNDYLFEYPKYLTYKNDNQLQWYSDACGNIENMLETDINSRLIINYENGIFYISAFKPLYKNTKINKTYHCICFSPSGNGQYAVNSITGANFQDDIVINLFFNTLNLKYSKNTEKQKSIRKKD